ncbi:MAG: DUF2232 domain-containing protein [Deltaproteobacteria bacterium]|nr:DUF2232 domain-containing protein [Deltaproteobacteria bacterium]
MAHLLKPFPDDASKGMAYATIALTGCCAISAFLPVIGFIVFMLLPAVVLFYRTRMERLATVFSITLSWVIISLLTGGLSADAFMMLVMMSLGLFMAEWIEKKSPVEVIVGFSSASVLGLAIMALMVYGNMSGTGMVQVLSDYISKNLDLTIAAYKQLGISDDRIAAISSAKVRIHYVLLRLLPGLAAAGLVLSAWMNLLAAREVFRRAGWPFAGQWPLNLWKAPEALVWGVIASLLILFMPVSSLRFIAANGMIILMAIYLLQGFAIVSFYFNLKNVPTFLRMTVYVIIGVQQLFLICIIGLGFFDIWINFRKLGVSKDPQTPLD